MNDPPGKRWQNHYAPVSKKFKIWIAGVSNVGPMTAGPWRWYACIGNSLLVDPHGNIAAKGPCGVEKEDVIYTDIHLLKRPARGNGWKNCGENYN